MRWSLGNARLRRDSHPRVLFSFLFLFSLTSSGCGALSPFAENSIWFSARSIMEDAIEKLALETVESAHASDKPESFETIDYVRELFLNSEEQKKLEHSQAQGKKHSFGREVCVIH